MHHAVQIGAHIFISVLALVFYFASRRQQGGTSPYYGLLLAMSLAYGLMAFGMWLGDKYSSYAGLGEIIGGLGVIIYWVGVLRTLAKSRRNGAATPMLVVNHPAPAKETRIYNDWAKPDPE